MTYFFHTKTAKKPFSVDRWCANCQGKWGDEIQREHEAARPRESKRKVRTVRSTSG